MKPKIKLHQNEEMIIDCRPKNSLIAYLFVLKLLRRLLTVLVIVLFVASDKNLTLLSACTSLEHGLQNNALITFVVVTSIVVLLLLWSVAYVRKRHFFFTSQRCIVCSGLFSINKKVLPYKSVVDVDLKQNPLRALLGINAVCLDQQGLGYGLRRRLNCLTVDGLDKKTSEKVLDLVSGHISAG